MEIEIKRYKEINGICGTSIDETVAELQKYKAKGELVCVDFNGVTLYSDNVTLDSAYLDIIGMTKSDFVKKQEEQRQQYENELQKHLQSIPQLMQEWSAKGREILEKEYWKEWDRCIPVRLHDLYQGMELKCCLDIVKALNDGCSISEAKKIIDSQNHSGASYHLVRLMVKTFCKRGNEFADSLK